MADPFISLDTLQDHLGRDLTQDPGAVFAIEAACDVCRDVAGQTFNRGTSTFYLDGTGTDALVLPELPANTIGTVTVNGTAITDYTLADNGCLFRGTVGQSDPYWPDEVPPGRVWPAGRRNVAVTYVHGYAADDVPRSVRMVALAVASRLIVQGPALEESLGDARVKYAGESTCLMPTEKIILRGYRRT